MLFLYVYKIRINFEGAGNQGACFAYPLTPPLKKNLVMIFDNEIIERRGYGVCEASTKVPLN